MTDQLPALANALNSPVVATGGDEGDVVPYVGFYDRRNSRAADITSALGDMQRGDPFIYTGGGYLRAAGLSYLLLKDYEFHGDFDDSYNLVGAVAERSPGYKQTIDAVMLFLPGSNPLPEAFRPALVTCSRFRGAQVGGVTQLAKAIKQTEEPEWAKENGEIVNAAPPRGRVVGSFRVTGPHTGRSGFTYMSVGSRVTPVSLAQLDAANTFLTSDEGQAALAAATALWERRVDEVQELLKVGDR